MHYDAKETELHGFIDFRNELIFSLCLCVFIAVSVKIMVFLSITLEIILFCAQVS